MNKHRVMTRIKYMPNHWGMHGFNRDPSLRNVSVTVNVGQLEEMAAGAAGGDQKPGHGSGPRKPGLT